MIGFISLKETPELDLLYQNTGKQGVVDHLLKIYQQFSHEVNMTKTSDRGGEINRRAQSLYVVKLSLQPGASDASKILPI